MKKLMMLLAAVALTSLTVSAQDAPSQTKAGRAVDKTANGVEKGARKTGHVVKKGAKKTGHAVKKGANKVSEEAKDAVN